MTHKTYHTYKNNYSIQMNKIWNFRPTIFEIGYSSFDLFKYYLYDCDKAEENARKCGRDVNPKLDGDNNLRTCQWNIHVLCAPWLESGTSVDHTTNVADALIETNSDVIILNEFGKNGRRFGNTRLTELCEKLEGLGYVIYEADCSYPTAIASRLPVRDSGRINLDCFRSAVYVDATLRNGKRVRIFGTHLEAGEWNNGAQRLLESQKLIATADKCVEEDMIGETREEERTLIIGDFNQQRQKDYTENEWSLICNNKNDRDSPKDDGVSSVLQEAGFSCNFDGSPEDGFKRVKCNWDESNPPPATHWTSTVIDYSYFRGNIDIKGIDVSPSKLSDHRMVVCDWEIN